MSKGNTGGNTVETQGFNFFGIEESESEMNRHSLVIRNPASWFNPLSKTSQEETYQEATGMALAGH